jgi:hypothetical protein
MKTTIEQELKDRWMSQSIKLEEIAKKGSLIPQIVVGHNFDDVVEVLFCESMAGGQRQHNNMPLDIQLTKLKMINGELHRFNGTYKLIIE